MLRLLFAIIIITIYIYSLVDCISTKKFSIQALPKAVWLLILTIIPLLGSILWFTFGKTKKFPKTQTNKKESPDDNSLFLRQLEIQKQQKDEAKRLKEWENKLKNKENNLDEEE